MRGKSNRNDARLRDAMGNVEPKIEELKPFMKAGVNRADFIAAANKDQLCWLLEVDPHDPDWLDKVHLRAIKVVLGERTLRHPGKPPAHWMEATNKLLERQAKIDQAALAVPEKMKQLAKKHLQKTGRQVERRELKQRAIEACALEQGARPSDVKRRFGQLLNKGAVGTEYRH